MTITEHAAGEDRSIVVYVPNDYGGELDPDAIFAAIATDAAVRDGDGWRIAAMAGLPLRHGGTMFGNDGSGFQTKVVVAVTYERVVRSG